jgi:hypothetical protein
MNEGFQMNLADELLNLIRAFNAANLEYAVCGGLALTIHGFVRATEDIDFLIPEMHLKQILEAAKTVGFWIPSGRMPFRAKTPMAMDIYRVSKASDSELVSLDLIVVSPGLKEVWDSRETFEFADVRCTVVSREGLIKMKSIAGRPQDLVDIERLKNGD